MKKIADITSGKQQTINVNCNHSAVDTAFLNCAMFSWFVWLGC